MHRTLLDHLPAAEGNSCKVIAVFVDVRNFTGFAGQHESVEAATFLKKFYWRAVTDYFPDAAFFKPTGDGLMIIYNWTDETLEERTNFAVSASCRLVDDFASLLDDDPVVNFDAPNNLGIGIARGAATCLSSGGTSLDYTGRPLNLAARLMDLARPEGIVFDQRMRPELLEEGTRALFLKDSVYVRGVAELEPIDVLYLKGRTRIPDSAHHQIGVYDWHTQTNPLTLAQMRERMSFEKERRYIHNLEKPPAFAHEVVYELQYRASLPNGRRSKVQTTLAQQPELRVVGGEYEAIVDYAKWIAALEAEGVKDHWVLQDRFQYRVFPELDEP